MGDESERGRERRGEMCGGERRESANKLISNLSCISLQQFQHREQHTAGRSSIGAAYPFMCKRLAKVASASSPCQSCHGALSKRSRDRPAGLFDCYWHVPKGASRRRILEHLNPAVTLGAAWNIAQGRPRSTLGGPDAGVTRAPAKDKPQSLSAQTITLLFFA